MATGRALVESVDMVSHLFSGATSCGACFRGRAPHDVGFLWDDLAAEHHGVVLVRHLARPKGCVHTCERALSNPTVRCFTTAARRSKILIVRPGTRQ